MRVGPTPTGGDVKGGSKGCDRGEEKGGGEAHSKGVRCVEERHDKVYAVEERRGVGGSWSG